MSTQREGSSGSPKHPHSWPIRLLLGPASANARCFSVPLRPSSGRLRLTSKALLKFTQSLNLKRKQVLSSVSPKIQDGGKQPLGTVVKAPLGMPTS